MSICFFSDLLKRDEMSALLSETGCGFETIRFSIADNLDHLEREISLERERLAAFNQPEIVVHGPFLDLNPMSFDSAIRKTTMMRFNQAYEAAHALGASKVVYHSGFIPSVCFLEGWASRMVEFWDEFLADKQGIQVCMENVFDPEIEPFVEVARSVRSADFGICLDVGHAHCYSHHSVEEWVCELGSFVKHIHLHDNDASRDAHFGLGQGTIEWGRTLPLIDEHCPKATCTIECANASEALASFRMWERFLATGGM